MSALRESYILSAENEQAQQQLDVPDNFTSNENKSNGGKASNDYIGNLFEYSIHLYGRVLF
jgi:hypothetical protein